MKRTSQLAALLLTLTSITAFFSCKKDDNSNADKTKTELLTTGSWKINAWTTDPALDWDGDGTVETNLFNILEACSKDDFYTFKTNATAEFNEGATKCYSSDPQTSTFSWNFTANETKLVFDGEEFTIVELTASTLKISDTYIDGGITYTELQTYVH